jgi:hypothetical protein
MIERVILNVNDKVYSLLNPSFVTMKETPLSVAEGGFRQCIINPLISFEFACAIAEDIKNHNMGKNSIRGRILTWNNYEIIVTAVDFMPRDYYPMKVTTIYKEEESV